MKKKINMLMILRIVLGFIFLWAFFDKLFGLGFATEFGKSWINGISPTSGFLKNAVYGPFSSIFNTLSGSIIVDILFMLALLLIGISLIFKINLKIGCYSGAVLMFLMWLSMLPPKNNPIIDEHIIYLLLFIYLSDKDE